MLNSKSCDEDTAPTGCDASIIGDRTQYMNLIIYKYTRKTRYWKDICDSHSKNITTNLLKSNSCDEATAPTGCDASLIGGKSHYTSLRNPTGKKKT